MESSMTGRHNASERFDYDLYTDRECSNQLLTPPESHNNFQGDDFGDQGNVSVSSTFFPGADIFGSVSDLIIMPSDSVYFYVHSHILLNASENGFNSMLPVRGHQRRDYLEAGPILTVPESSPVFNIVLHVIYDVSCTQYSPSFDTLVKAVSALITYGVTPKKVITPSTPLYDILLTHATSRPLDLFALASQHDLEDLAIASSVYLLSFSLSTISDEMAERIGPVYLKRLFFMHLGRAEVLRSILLPPPYPHTPTPACDYGKQKNLTRAWTLASAHLAWDARADLSVSAIESALEPLGDRLSCGLCQAALRERIKVLTTRWSRIKDDLSFTIGSSPLHIYLQNYISDLPVKPRSP
ncbi:hypothetical protein PILCRDRAFT_109264 [Piloderma croceum F 1598]|uniref:BTB domain-containing protein n=1 Tax=Piloderma croceum (strain F 1598) TaxID=765440 RepID=A0A0C3GK86_PILCF|nr:hypothetical protein PILCRDRAFT_109264 [Piloderma croceum F 1598]